MASAWQVKDYAIVGGPGWVDSDRFDIVAKSPSGTSTKDFQLMLRNLLTERFQISVHQGERVVPVYALVVDNGGPKFAPAGGKL